MRRLYLALAVSLLLSGCGGQGDSEETPRGAPEGGEKTVVVAQTVDIAGVNELTTEATAIHNAIIYFAMFLPLVDEQADYQEGPPSFEPWLAESYEFSDDRKVLTFHLRENVVWSDGVPVTAEDVRWTWQAQTDPDVVWEFVDSKMRISDVEAVDPHTVRFHFTEAYATQLQDANMGVILPKHAWSRLPFPEWRQNNGWFVDNLVVNGAFTLETWEPQQRFVLRRNERYFEEGIPKVDRVVFQITQDTNAQLALLRSGQAHLVEWIQPADLPAIDALPDVRIVTYIPRYFYFITWNVRRPVFAEPEVRRALTMALDRQGMIDSLQSGYATVSHSPFASDHWAHNKNLEPWPYDPGRAKELLAEQGWSDSDGDGILERDGRPFHFELVTNAGNPLRRDITIMVQEQLRRIGVDAQPRIMEFNALMAPLHNHEFDAVISALAMDTSLNLTFYFHTRGIDDGVNWGAYSNPEMDRIIEQLGEQADQLAAKALYDRMQELLHRDQPLTFLYEARRPSGVRPALQDYKPNSISSFFNIREWRLVEE